MVSLLGGCGAVDYQLIINSNGVITERIYLPKVFPISTSYILEKEP